MVKADDDDDLFKSLSEELDHLQEKDPSAIQEELSADSFIGLGWDVVTTCSPGTNAEFKA